MKQTHAINIIATPTVVNNSMLQNQCNCPDCGKEMAVKSDGSTFCNAEGKFFEPESNDTELMKMRQEFDKKQGITVSDRVLNPLRLMGMPGTGRLAMTNKELYI